MATLFSETVDTNSDGWDTATLVGVYTTAALTLPSFSIARIRITISASTAQGVTVTNCYIGHGSSGGDSYDFAATPTQVTFNNGSAGITISSSSTGTSDWINFAYNKSSDLVIATYYNGGTSSDALRVKAVPASGVTAFFKVANDAATVNKTGYTSYADSGVSLIEVEAGGNFFLLF